MTSLSTVFILLVIYQLKHFLADYPLQGAYMLKKFLPGWGWVKPLAAHAGVHAGFTTMIAIVFAEVTQPSSQWSWHPVLGLAAFDFVVHFTMDRIKASPNLMGRWKALSGAEYMALKSEVDSATVTFNRALDDYGTVSTPNVAVSNVYAALKTMVAAREKAAPKFFGNKLFWICLGIDQAVHHLTHYAIIWMLVR